MRIVSYMLFVLLARGSSPMAEHAVTADSATAADYRTFGGVESLRINVLEAHVLKPICKALVSLTDPAKSKDEIDVLLHAMTVRDQEITIITSLLIADNPFIFLNRLMNRFGFAGQYLLAKLSSQAYIAFLESDVSLPVDRVLMKYFIRMLRLSKPRLKLQQVNEALNCKIASELWKTLVQYASDRHPNNSSFDYVIYTLAREQSVRIPKFEYAHLLQYWMCTNSDPHWLIPFLKGYLRVLLHPEILPERKQMIMRKELVRYVVSKDDMRYLELFELFNSAAATKSYVSKCLKKSDWRDINPHFILNYLGIFEMGCNDLCDSVICKTWAAYLKTPAYFVGMKNCWSENRVYFNKIGPKWLRGFFSTLSKGVCAPQLNSDAIMDKYMNMLDLSTFLRISKICTRDPYIDMPNIMFKHLNATSKRAYEFGLLKLEREGWDDKLDDKLPLEKIMLRIFCNNAQEQCDDSDVQRVSKTQPGTSKIESTRSTKAVLNEASECVASQCSREQK
ncbi:hypothetical protein PAPHI01_0388 [Pancytospora philotis]|nr:hypothetical protein PAPHI01_0362 [Pancytospora philotis]KAI4291114.1 hypothetical protein PAPHI01_0388 [Pancytospora philotis]